MIFRRLKQKTAQIKMFETIAVLIIFFILLAAGFAFYSNFERHSIKTEQMEQESKEAIEIAQRASLIPELICSSETVTDNCFDLYKVMSFSEMIPNESNMDERMYYYYLFGLSNITITVHPLKNFEREGYVLNDSRKRFSIYENIPNTYTSKSVLFYPIIVYEPIYEINHFGVLRVEVYN